MTRLHVPAVALALAVATAAAAQEEEPAQGLHHDTYLAFVDTSGNTDTTTLSLEHKSEYRSGPWTASGKVVGIYGETDGEESANHWGIRGDVGRDLNDRLTLTGFVGWERNRFAGIDRRFNEGVGLSFKVVRPKPHTLTADAGIVFTQERNILDLSDEFVAGRVAALYQFDFTEKSYFRQTVELLPSFEDGDDLRVNSETALVAPIRDGISMKFSYIVRHDGQPEPGFDETDRILSAGIQLSY